MPYELVGPDSGADLRPVLGPGLCLCGCGSEVRKRYLPGHDNYRRTTGCGLPGHDVDRVYIHTNGRRSKQCYECWKDRSRRHAKEKHQRLRSAALEAYGGVCACCGESNTIFLVIDHVNGGGNAHRREIGQAESGGSQVTYRWLKTHKYPPGFRVLCHNCNYAWSLGTCPHQEVMPNALRHQQPAARP